MHEIWSKICRMRYACWITKATNTNSEYLPLNTYHGNNCNATEPQCFVTRTLPLLQNHQYSAAMKTALPVKAQLFFLNLRPHWKLTDHRESPIALYPCLCRSKYKLYGLGWSNGSIWTQSGIEPWLPVQPTVSLITILGYKAHSSHYISCHSLYYSYLISYRKLRGYLHYLAHVLHADTPNGCHATSRCIGYPNHRIHCSCGYAKRHDVSPLRYKHNATYASCHWLADRCASQSFFLSAFAKLRKATISLAMPIRPPVCLHGKTAPAGRVCVKIRQEKQDIYI